ncbi:MAG: ATP-binding protein, partial [Lysobacterales bacterium]
GLMSSPRSLETYDITGTVLISYVIMAGFLTYESRKRSAQSFFLARVTLFTDVFFLSILLFVFSGLANGVIILLMFTSAAAAVLLPLRIALFIASLVILVFFGKSVSGILIHDESLTTLVAASLYGLTIFGIALLANLISRWSKDFRVIAERQAVQLTRLEQVNELVIRRMRAGVLAVDSEGLIQLMNESAWFLLGSPKADEKNLAKVAPQINLALKNWQVDPTVESVPLKLYASQARVLPKFVSLPGETSIRVLIFLEDNELVSQRSLEMSAHLLSNLSGSIAHEIRNPLGAVSHAAQLLEESDEIAEADLRLVDIIHTQSNRMNGIIENILQLSRHEKSRPDVFELTPFLEELAVEAQNSLPSVRLILDIHPEEGKTSVLFDQSQLHQAVWKLLENAMRHAHLDAAIPQVVLSMKHLKGTGYCVITVEDNGPGIPEDNLERIFEPFFTTHKQGSGLGLYIARQLCDVNRAEITVDSVLGSCSRFHIRLALARSEVF